MCCVYVKLLFLILWIYSIECDDFEKAEPLNKVRYRNSRTCKHRPYSAFEPFYRQSILESPVYLVFIVLLGILFGLMFLGLLKGLLGMLGSKTVGEYGMGMLIDLPKPLDSYQEKELRNRSVCYDVVGWPVHPDTGERTVRMLPIQSEFCLNIIFFLAYPLAILLKLCSLCCCIGDYKGEEDACFREVNVIKCKSSRKNAGGPQLDMYKEHDLREAKDTNYVINCMRQSQMSLGKFHQFSDM
ncbi:uncharacterized protein LOC109546905 [Dendroctonus ponderosae]|uniref:Uncharacterized protein n=1 Tax=Dendroctonus ponderosae TaxID=77166 RepID=U4UR45_DENPD|nr:uncharacterized protein LOC109546905 [Dendroctonus ponderosae]ERL92626.1 hypothetical protein D910_09939 [Dendroctonus ponderosae]KAH1014463.1 hypothetical protein HUJ05_012325 [Dendroctonus ponderosae]